MKTDLGNGKVNAFLKKKNVLLSLLEMNFWCHFVAGGRVAEGQSPRSQERARRHPGARRCY